jgi:hypothetical protein
MLSTADHTRSVLSKILTTALAPASYSLLGRTQHVESQERSRSPPEGIRPQAHRLQARTGYGGTIKMEQSYGHK